MPLKIWTKYGITCGIGATSVTALEICQWLWQNLNCGSFSSISMSCLTCILLYLSAFVDVWENLNVCMKTHIYAYIFNIDYIDYSLNIFVCATVGVFRSEYLNVKRKKPLALSMILSPLKAYRRPHCPAPIHTNTHIAFAHNSIGGLELRRRKKNYFCILE